MFSVEAVVSGSIWMESLWLTDPVYLRYARTRHLWA